MALLVSSAKAECQNFEPANCGPEEIKCGGVVDDSKQPWTGCPEPEWCMPSKGPMAKDGVTACPDLACPKDCGWFLAKCPGPVDDNGCIWPEYCVPPGVECCWFGECE